MSRKDFRQAKAEKRAKKAAKNERRTSQRIRDSRQSNMLLSGLAEAEQSLKEGFLEESVEILEELARRYPRQLEVLAMLLETYFQLHDMWSYQSVCQRLIELEPDEVDAWLNLAGAALGNSQMATAHRAFNQVLSRWPDHEETNNARKACAGLEEILQAEMAKYGMSLEDGYNVLLLHDEINFHLHQGDYQRVISVAERLLARCPTFVPALNNRSEAWFRAGDIDLAMADARRVLEFDADNFHALANLPRYLFLSGQFDEAQTLVKRLKAVDSESPDLFIKQAQTLGILGNWQDVLDTLERAEARGIDDTSGDMGILYHLAGVASAELGQLKDARRHWKRAIKMSSVAEWAQQNLDDLKLPPGEQNGPWAFPIDSWIPRAVMDQLVTELERNSKKTTDAELRRRLRKFFERHPYLEQLAPLLLERGDAATKEFVIRIASLSGLPSILSALQEFAFGQRGPDQVRYQAALRLIEAEHLPPGTLKMWRDGEWQDTIFTSFEITTEPKVKLPAKLERLAREAFDAINMGDGADAERLLTHVLAELPDDPSMLFNFAVAIAIQGREEEALARVHDIHQRFPDYLFARLRLVQNAAERKDFEAAHALLDPLLKRTRFHSSEYTALCASHIELLMAEGKKEGARSWLKMWRDMDPEDPKLMIYEERLRRRGLLGKFFS